MISNRNKGFVALISVIIISLVLMLVATTLGFSGFYGRYNVLDAELKEVGVRIAEACADTAIVQMVIDPDYSGNEDVDVGGGTCAISPIALGTERNIEISTVYKDYHTNLEVVVDTADFSIVSWTEVPNF